MENITCTPRTHPGNTRPFLWHQEFQAREGAQGWEQLFSGLSCIMLSVGRETGTGAHKPNPTFPDSQYLEECQEEPGADQTNEPSSSPSTSTGWGTLGRKITGKCKAGAVKGQLEAIVSRLIPGALPPAECQFPSAAMELVSLVSWPEARPCRRMGKGAVCANRGAVTGPAAASPRHHFTILRVC